MAALLEIRHNISFYILFLSDGFDSLLGILLPVLFSSDFFPFPYWDTYLSFENENFMSSYCIYFNAYVLVTILSFEILVEFHMLLLYLQDFLPSPSNFYHAPLKFSLLFLSTVTYTHNTYYI